MIIMKLFSRYVATDQPAKLKAEVADGVLHPAERKGRKMQQVLLPEIVSRSLLSLRGDAGVRDLVFASRQGGGRPTERSVHGIVKRTEKAAGTSEYVSPHLLRGAHDSHAIERRR
jgi:integrase